MGVGVSGSANISAGSSSVDQYNNYRAKLQQASTAAEQHSGGDKKAYADEMLSVTQKLYREANYETGSINPSAEGAAKPADLAKKAADVVISGGQSLVNEAKSFANNPSGIPTNSGSGNVTPKPDSDLRARIDPSEIPKI